MSTALANANGDLFPDPLFSPEKKGTYKKPEVVTYTKPKMDFTLPGGVDVRVGSTTHPILVSSLDDLQRKLEEKYIGAKVNQMTIAAINADANAILRGQAVVSFRSPHRLEIYPNSMGTSVSLNSITMERSLDYVPTPGAFNLGTAVDFVPTSSVTTGTVDFFISTAGSAASYSDFSISKEAYKAYHFRQKMKSNLLIQVKSRNYPIAKSISPAEEIARNSLRDLLSEQEWRRYVTNGFIMVKGQSGRFYQVFNSSNRERIRVYYKNKHTHSICIHSDQSVPPTDHVLNMKLLIELDEQTVWKGGNVSTMDYKRTPVVPGMGNGLQPIQTLLMTEDFALAC